MILEGVMKMGSPILIIAIAIGIAAIAVLIVVVQRKKRENQGQTHLVSGAGKSSLLPSKKKKD